MRKWENATKNYSQLNKNVYMKSQSKLSAKETKVIQINRIYSHIVLFNCYTSRTSSKNWLMFDPGGCKMKLVVQYKNKQHEFTKKHIYG